MTATSPSQAPTGRIKIAQGKTRCAVALGDVSHDPMRVTSQVSERYVEMCLLSERGRTFFRSRAQGISGTMPKIDQETVELAPIPLPPLAEQSRIVVEVELRLSVVEELETVVTSNLARAERLRQSILQKAFTGQQ